MKRLFTIALLCVAVAGASAAKKKTGTPPPITPAGFAGIAPGNSRSQISAKGFACKDEHIGDYMVIVECRKAMEFAGVPVQGFAQMNSSGKSAESVGFDTYFPGDSIGAAQNQFYKFEKAVEAMLGVQPSVTATPDTYLAMTNFKFPKSKTIVSCFLYSDDRTKPPRLRCGCEVRASKR